MPAETDTGGGGRREGIKLGFEATRGGGPPTTAAGPAGFESARYALPDELLETARLLLLALPLMDAAAVFVVAESAVVVLLLCCSTAASATASKCCRGVRGSSSPDSAETGPSDTDSGAIGRRRVSPPARTLLLAENVDCALAADGDDDKYAVDTRAAAAIVAEETTAAAPS